MALTLPGDLQAASHARSLLDLLLRRFGVTLECRNDLAVVITEACTNAVRHAHHPSDIEIAVTVDTDRCVIDVGNTDGRFHDAQLHAGQPDPFAEHGRGLAIIGALTDTARIHHDRPGWVVLHMVKRIARLDRTPVPS